jgi:Tol biopolymer transport system component
MLFAVALSGCMRYERTEGILATPATPSQPHSTVKPGETTQPGSGERLFVLDAGKLYEIVGSERILFAEGPDSTSLFDAAVSPDGTNVALSVHSKPRQGSNSYDFGIDLYVAHDGEEPFVVAAHEKIGESMSNPNWLPDGHQLIFMVLGRDETGGIDLHIDHVDLRTGNQERLIDYALEPSVSNDGSTLAYVAYDLAIGSEVIMLADLSTGQARPLLPEGTLLTNIANIAWSREDDRLVFAASDPLAPPGGGFGRSAVIHPTLRDIWMVGIHGTGLRRLTDLADSTLSLAWSADDRHVYALGDTGFWRIDTTNGGLESIGPPVLGGVVQTLIN